MDNIATRMNGSASAGRNAGDGSNNQGHHGKKRKIKLKHISMIVGIVLVVGMLTFCGLNWYNSTTSASINSGEYQAVFFTNGQVYFGKLHSYNSEYMKLTDVYYLQADTAKSATDSSTLQDATSSESEVQLIKLGSEIHGPSDEMIISKSQILFFENLKKDGRVAESIAKYLKQK